MLDIIRDRLNSAFAHWIKVVQAYPVKIILLGLVLVALAFYYAVNHLSMNTDTEAMLSEQLAWRQLDRALDREFPQRSDNILLVIEARTADQAMDTAAKLTQQLQLETDLFQSVFSLRSLPFFKQSALLYLSPTELQDLADRLVTIQPLLARLGADQSIRGLFTIIQEAIKANLAEQEMIPLLKEINKTLDAVIQGRPYQISWQRLISDETAPKVVYREFIVLKPKLDFTRLFPAQAALDKITELEQSLGIGLNNQVQLHITGDAALSHEELENVTQGTKVSVLVALLIVIVIVSVGLGSLWLAFATIVTLMCGLILTAGWAALTVGELNLISIAFAVLYIGLGVDFSIHFCLRYREHLCQHHDRTAAIYATSESCGHALFLCALTTAAGFYAFTPTDYNGLAELGWISGSGMLISFFVTTTLLPAVLRLLPYRAANHTENLPHLLAFPNNHARMIKLVFMVVGLGLLWAVPKVEFDHNKLNLQNPDNESVQTFLGLLADSETSPWIGEILADDEPQARQLATQLKKLPLVSDVVWVNQFIPKQQEDKLVIIEDLNLLMRGLNTQQNKPAPSDDEQHRAIQELAALLEASPQAPHATLLKNLNAFLIRYQQSQQQGRLLARLEHSLLASLPGRLDTLAQALNAEYVNQLPKMLTTRWIGTSGQYLLEILPRENLNDNQALERFVTQLQANFPNVIGAPVISLAAGQAVVSAFQQAFIGAFIFITIILFILTDKRRDVILILLVLSLAVLMTAGVSVLFGIPLNFANIIALPLLLGIGVDSSIHILHRFRTALPQNGLILATSSAKAVLVSALTTIVSIGNLAFSPHTGTASMGKLLTIGISMTLLCTLILLPALLAPRKEAV